eukprot:UN01382
MHKYYHSVQVIIFLNFILYLDNEPYSGGSPYSSGSSSTHTNSHHNSGYQSQNQGQAGSGDTFHNTGTTKFSLIPVPS